MSLKKGIAIIFGANLLNLIFNLLTNFLLPKYLSVDCYAEIKTFQLYVSYSGILHLGYEDGMYIKYGGKTINQIDTEEFKTDLNTLVIFQLLLAVFLIGGAVSAGDLTLLACAVAIFPLNIVGCYKLLFQAIGEFGLYANISNTTTAITFAANAGLLLFNCFTQYQYYLGSYVLIDILMVAFCIFAFQKKNPTVAGWNGKLFSGKIMIENIKSGIFLMLGNFSSMILTGMDRWFIKALMDNTAFAMYSFAVSMEGLMNVAVTPVSTTLYNYFCSHTNTKELKKIKSKIVLFATAIIICAFPAKFILETFLPHYMEAASVIFYLFAAQTFYIIVKCLYVNLYKAQKRQKIYFIKLIVVIIVGFVLNALFYAMLHTKEAFAIGTMLCGALWFLLSERDFKNLTSSHNELLYLFLSVVIYLIVGIKFEAILGMLIYVGALCLLAFMLMRQDVIDCLKIMKKIVTQLKGMGKQ